MQFRMSEICQTLLQKMTSFSEIYRKFRTLYIFFKFSKQFKNDHGLCFHDFWGAWSCVHTLRPSNIYPIPSVWSKTALIRSCVGGAGADPPTSKIRKFSIKDLIGLKLSWGTFKILRPPTLLHKLLYPNFYSIQKGL